MRIACKSAWAALRRKKFQTLLIGMIILLVSAMLATGMSLITFQNPFDIMFDRANGMEGLLIVSRIGDDVDRTIDWWTDQPSVKAVDHNPATLSTVQYQQDDEDKSDFVFLTEYPMSDYNVLYTDAETIAPPPQMGEVLINRYMARARNLQIGDEITMDQNGEKYTFTIAGLVVDPQFTNPFLNPDRCFVAPGTFEAEGITSDLEIVGFKYHDIAAMDELAMLDAYKAAVDPMGAPIFVEHRVVESSYKLLLSVIGAILMGVTILMMLVVIFAIRSTIQNAILQQFRTIGVRKALGYTARQIRWSLVLQYAWIALATAVIGALISLPIRDQIQTLITQDIQVSTHSALDMWTVLTVLLVSALVIVFSLLSARRANRVRPVQAIKYGMPTHHVHHSRYRINRHIQSPLMLRMAVKHMLANRRKTLSTLVLITLMVFVTLVIYQTGYTISQERHVVIHLFGMRIGDYTVSDDSRREIGDMLDQLHDVESIETAIHFDVSIAGSLYGTDGKKAAIGGLIMRGDVPDDFLLLEDGRMPAGDSEIVVSTDAAALSGRGAGDYLTIDLGETSMTALITGTYRSISNGSMSYVQLLSGDSAEPGDGFYWVYTRDAVDMNTFSDQVMQSIGDEAIVTQYDSNVRNVISSLTAFPTVVRILLWMFMAIALVIVLNSTIMDIHNDTRNYGIMKAVGFSRQHIVMILLTKTVLITLLGCALGALGSHLLVDRIMGLVFAITPFASIQLPIITDYAGMAWLLLAFIGVTIAATWMPTGRIGRISPKQLIAE